MRRSTAVHVITIVTAYVIVAVALLVWSRSVVREAAWSVMESTAQLVSLEITSALHHELSELTERPRATSDEVLTSIVDLVARSTTVLEVTVVDGGGNIVASTRRDIADHGLPTPAQLFTVERVIRIESSRGRPLDDARFVVDVPIRVDGRIAGYVRLLLTSDRLEAIVHQSYLVVLAVATVGLVALVGLGLALHLRFARAMRSVMSALTPHRRGRDELDASVDSALRTAEGLHRRLMDAETGHESVRQRLDLLADTLNMGIVMVDRDREVEVATDRARRLLAELDLAPPGIEPVDALVATLEPLLDAAASGLGTQRCVVPEDATGSAGLQVEVVAVGDTTTDGWVVNLRDRQGVTALARDLVEAARLRSLAQLLLGVTHDLRAPLNAMVLTVENLRERAQSMAQPADDRDTTLDMLSVLEREAQRLERTLDAVFTHTVSAAARTGPFDLVELVETTAQLIASQSKQQGVRFHLDLPDRPVVVEATEDHIRQAVLNVAVNALEEMEDGGELTITLGIDDQTAVVRIADTGGGIPEPVRDTLFDLHVTSKDSGTGIGLYVARMTVEEAGGRLTVETTGADGTVFRLALPLKNGDG